MNHTSKFPFTDGLVTTLRATLTGKVFLPGDEGYAAETAAHNPNLMLTPGVTVAAESEEDVRRAVSFANSLSMPIAVTATGHQVLDPAENGMLINVSRLNSVTIDPETHVAVVGGGTRWHQVLDEASKVGLAPVAGAASGVGVVGYTLGGGVSPVLGRSQGYASDHVLWIRLVTADGTLHHVDPVTDPHLFAALRGGKGSFGVVTEMAFRLFPATRFHGGALFFAGEDLAEVLHTWREWAPELGEQTTTSVVVVRTPPAPELPEPVRGRLLVSVRFAHLGPEEEADHLLAPLRAAAPVVFDTIGEKTFPEIGDIHTEPADPLPTFSASSGLSAVTPELVDQLVALVGPGSTSGLIVEIRALGGAWDRSPRYTDSVPMRGVPFLMFALAVGGHQQERILRSRLDELMDAVAPWATTERSPNFIAATDRDRLWEIFGAENYARLVAAKRRHDPKNLFRLGHRISGTAAVTNAHDAEG